MKILWHLPSNNSTNADIYICNNYRMAFEDMGHQFRVLEHYGKPKDAFKSFKPDIFITNTMQPYIDYLKPYLKWIKKFCENYNVKRLAWTEPLIYNGKKVIYGEKEKLIEDNMLADAFFGYWESEYMKQWEEKFGYRYTQIMLAANKFYSNGNCRTNMKHDIFFNGAYLREKRKLFKQLLLPLRKKYDLLIIGKRWTFRERFADWIANKTGLWILSSYYEPVPEKMISDFYTSSKISPNIHLEGQQKEGVDLNERTFKIPCAGGFEICDWNKALRKHFTKNEIVMAENKKDWFEKIDYFMQPENEDERKRIILRGQKKVLREHTYHNRVKKILNLR